MIEWILKPEIRCCCIEAQMEEQHRGADDDDDVGKILNANQAGQQRRARKTKTATRL